MSAEYETHVGLNHGPSQPVSYQFSQQSAVKQLKCNSSLNTKLMSAVAIDFFTLSLSEDAPFFEKLHADIELRCASLLRGPVSSSH